MKKKYFIVALERYKNNRYKTLPGVLSSAINWEYKLIDLGYEGISLYNEFATKENFNYYFEKIIQTLKSDDIFTFIFIGHGDNQNSNDINEKDNKNELIILYDYDYLDKDIRKNLDKNSENFLSYLVFDCCYNGVIEHQNTFTISKNEIAISSSSHLQKSFIYQFIDGQYPLFSYTALQYFDSNLSIIEWFDIIFEKINWLQKPNLIYTNESLLKNKIFLYDLSTICALELEKLIKKNEIFIGIGQIKLINQFNKIYSKRINP